MIAIDGARWKDTQLGRALQADHIVPVGNGRSNCLRNGEHIESDFANRSRLAL
jgi:hypothetical protein